MPYHYLRLCVYFSVGLAKDVNIPHSEYIAIIKERLIGAAKLAVVVRYIERTSLCEMN